MRVGCGSATIGMFASQWRGLVDEVVVVDDHITGVVSEHQAGKVLGWEDTGIKIVGRRSTPGRYFKVSEPGLGWGGTTISDPLAILGEWNAKKGARPGLSLLMVSTTGEQFAYYELDDALKPVAKPFPERLRRSVSLIEENCEPALCTVLFMGGAGGSLRAGVVDNPVNLTRSVHALGTYVTCRRRAGLCLAGRRHHLHGRRDTAAGQCLRLCADAGAGGADRVHHAPRPLRAARRPCRRGPLARRRAGQRRRISERSPVSAGAVRQPVATAAASSAASRRMLS